MSQPNSTLVLSYNICFQAMCNDNYGSAAALGGSCVWKVEHQLTICAQNMADFMDGAPGSAGHNNFDFVGLQESNNVTYLQQAAKQSLARLAMKTSKTHATHGGHSMHMASLFDASKYTLVDFVPGTFNSYKTDRPFHILLLSNNTSGEETLFINCHVPHGSSQNTKYPSLYYSSFEAVSHDLSDAVKHIKSFDPTHTYRIIITGDFNECGWDWNNETLCPMKWQPLLQAGLSTDVSITNFVLSTSQSDGCWHSANGQRGGDYIFTSGPNGAKINVPANYRFAPTGKCNDVSVMKSIWQSDHLPVMAELS